MDINGTQRFNSSPQQVWDALHNSATMQGCVPGASSVAWEAGAFVITGSLSLGPINRTGTARIQVSDEQSPRHMKLSIQRASVTATATIDLAPDGAGTNLTYNAHADLAGAYGAAAMIVKPIVDSQLKQFFSCLASKLG
jgi:carbon monoxide dehydrogenase subunit G